MTRSATKTVGGAQTLASPKDSASPSPVERANAKLDMHAPLVWQMFKLSREEYMAWVHEAYCFDGSVNGQRDARLFHWDWMEPLSKTVWWVIPLVWLPVSAFMWHWYVQSPAFDPVHAALIFGGGVLGWTLVEYAIHRFIFHLDDYVPDFGLALLVHFLLHGIHHKVPMDRYRLVMPPALFAILAGIAYLLVRPVALLVMSPAVMHAAYGSVFVGYVIYDLMHYSQHHMRFAKGSYFGGMKQYHMKHHFSGLQNVGYGITSKLWDVVFNTVLDIELANAMAKAGNNNMEAIGGKHHDE